MPRHLTVVYTINDDDEFKQERERVFSMFRQADEVPFAITCIGIDHEVQRLYWIEEAADRTVDYYELRKAIEAIVNHRSIGNVTDLSEIIDLEDDD